MAKPAGVRDGALERRSEQTITVNFSGGASGTRNQLQWVALLAITVLLPTVALLWFMSRVVGNERLAVQQKLALLYQEKLAGAMAKTDAQFSDWLSGLDKIEPGGNPYAVFKQLVLTRNCRGVAIWDTDGGNWPK